MKISVIIPVYNGEKYVAECLDGMMRQTHKDLELIVVNDGSTDCSLEIAKQYPGVRIISFEENRGLSAARNAGIDAATGAYIHFMDVDDMINEEFYERLTESAEATGSDIACCGMIHEPKPHRTTLFDEQRVLTEPREKFPTARNTIPTTSRNIRMVIMFATGMLTRFFAKTLRITPSLLSYRGHDTHQGQHDRKKYHTHNK